MSVIKSDAYATYALIFAQRIWEIAFIQHQFRKKYGWCVMKKNEHSNNSYGPHLPFRAGIHDKIDEILIPVHLPMCMSRGCTW
jgi:hypothetical protein